jgi:membrane protein DedA with SNARE-associated domain
MRRFDATGTRRPTEGVVIPAWSRPGRVGHPGCVADWVFSIVDRLGAVGVGLLILLENLIPPIPSEVILPLAGFRARTGTLSLLTVWPAATAGAVLGALALYALGAWLGYDRLHRLAGKRWFVFTSQSDLERGHALFDKHGGKVVLLARCVPFVRSVVSVPAGVARMPLLRFTVLTAIGSGIWNAVFLGLGWILGENWGLVEGWLEPASYVVVGLVAIGVVVLVVRRLRNRSRSDASDRTEVLELPPDAMATAPIVRTAGPVHHSHHSPPHAPGRPGPSGPGRPARPGAPYPGAPGPRPSVPGGPHIHGRPGHASTGDPRVRNGHAGPPPFPGSIRRSF